MSLLDFMGSAGGAGIFGLIGAGVAAGASHKALQDQMKFQERMRATAYQTAMADMRKAGLNPILAYQQGGAPMAMGGRMEYPNVAAAGFSAGQVAQGIKKLRAETLTEAERARRERKQGDLFGAQSHVAAQQQWILRLQRRMLEAQIPTAKQMEAWTKTETGQWWNRWKFTRDRALGAGGPSSWIPPIKGLTR